MNKNLMRSSNRKLKLNVIQNDNDNILIPHEQEPDEQVVTVNVNVMSYKMIMIIY